MKKTIIAASIAFLIGLGATIALAIPQSQSPFNGWSPSINAGGSRACLFASGAWTVIDCSNVAAAESAALNQWSRYVMQCGDDSYVRWGTTAVLATPTAATAAWLPMGAWTEFMTDGDIVYVGCLNKNVDSDCRILECK